MCILRGCRVTLITPGDASSPGDDNQDDDIDISETLNGIARAFAMHFARVVLGGLSITFLCPRALVKPATAALLSVAYTKGVVRVFTIPEPVRFPSFIGALAVYWQYCPAALSPPLLLAALYGGSMTF